MMENFDSCDEHCSYIKLNTAIHLYYFLFFYGVYRRLT